tara:strand:- start:4252 stop:4851 length:600 start_codon:yes stop_codon:yes gene_type:complete
MRKKTFKNKKNTRNTKKRRVFTKKQYNSGDGMLTTVWGPGLWHYLHTMSFNYPIQPTQQDKREYKNFIVNLQYTLPCKYCRVNLNKNFKQMPIQSCHMKNRGTFSKYVYNLHEFINKMLHKKSGLSYCDVRERYENFRAHCVEDKKKLFSFSRTKKNKKEKGCTTPLYGKKAKCIIKIVPQEDKCKTLQIDNKCIKKAF